MRASKSTSFINDRLVPGDRVMAIDNAGLYRNVDDAYDYWFDAVPPMFDLNEGTTLLIISKRCSSNSLAFLVVASLGATPVLGWINSIDVYGFDLPIDTI
jgi:hypothetical protein